MNRITFANGTFAGEISTGAMSNVTVGEFSISDSSIERLDHVAFDITVTKTFAIERTRIDHIEELAFHSIRASASASTTVMSLLNVSASDVADNAFKIGDHFKNGGGTNITYETSCDCDMYRISGIDKFHKPMNSTPLDNDLTLSSDTMLNFVNCEDGGRYIPWSLFDAEKCAQDHGHVNDGILIPSISGLGKKITLAIILGGGAGFVIGLYFLHTGIG